MNENQRLKEVRKTLNLSQRTFSEILGIKQGSYSDIERGKTGISAVMIKGLITKFRVDPLWLCEGKGDMFINKNGVPQRYTDDNLSGDISLPATEDEDESKNVSSESLTSHLDRQKHYIESIKGMLEFLKEK
jgi:transcriptional regulator with XRE-family HTH domain